MSNWLNLTHRVIQILLVIKEIFSRLVNIAYLHIIAQNVFVNSFCCMSHHNSSIESCLFHEVGQGSTVVKMMVSDHEQIYLGGINGVEVGKSVYAVVSRMDATVEHDLLAFVLHNHT